MEWREGGSQRSVTGGGGSERRSRWRGPGEHFIFLIDSNALYEGTNLSHAAQSITDWRRKEGGGLFVTILTCPSVPQAPGRR